jgi:arginase family enzyme
MGQPSIAVTGETFLRAPRALASELGPGDVGILGVGHELTKISRAGVAHGPRAIRDATQMVAWGGEAAAENLGNGFVDIVRQRAYRYAKWGIYDLGDVPVGPNLDRNRERIRSAVAEIARSGAMPMILGGERYLSHPAVTGVADAEPGKLAFFSFDMHTDLADEIPEFGRYNGGTFLRRLIDEGTIDPARVVIFGAGSQVTREEWEFVTARGIQVISAQQIFRDGVAASLGPALERALDGADGLYAAIDIDVGARSLVPGTGDQTGVVGLSPGQMLEVASQLAEAPLKGVDITELSPPLDPCGHTAGLAATMLLTILERHLYEPADFPVAAGHRN